MQKFIICSQYLKQFGTPGNRLVDPCGSLRCSNCPSFIWKFTCSHSGILNHWAFGRQGSLAFGSIVQIPALLPNYLFTCRTDVDMPEIS